MSTQSNPSKEALCSAWLIWKAEVGEDRSPFHSVTQIARMIDAGFAEMRNELAAMTAERDAKRKEVDWLQLNNDMLTDDPAGHARALAERAAIIAERDVLLQRVDALDAIVGIVTAHNHELSNEAAKLRSDLAASQERVKKAFAVGAHDWTEENKKLRQERDQLRADLAQARKTIKDIATGARE